MISLPTYLVLTTLTDKGRETIKEKPNRIKEVNKEIERMGGEIKSQYALFGKFDFVNIIEVPDEQTMAKISIEIGSRGSTVFQTYQAMDIEELIEST